MNSHTCRGSELPQQKGCRHRVLGAGKWGWEAPSTVGGDMRVAQTQVEESRGVDITEEMVSQHGFDWQAIVWGYPRCCGLLFL